MISQTILFSGPSFDSLSFHHLILRAPLLAKFLRLKPSPQFVLQNKSAFNLEDWLALLSQISTGPTFKTTFKDRSPKSDKLILELLKSSPKAQIADIGTSSGASVLHLAKNLKPSQTLHIFDKFNHLLIQPQIFHHNILNSQHQLVAKKFPGFLLHTWHQNSPQLKPKKSDLTLDFTDSAALKANLKLQLFDIFQTKSPQKFDLIRVANVLNLSYFSKSQIKQALQNLHQNLKPKGHLILIHNLKNQESFLLLQKTPSGFKVIQNHSSELASLFDFPKLTLK